jgi:hypothetical protein
MNELDRAFIQSFNDEYNKIMSKVVSTSENTNVDKLFKNINIPSECIICYDENVPCLKCYQCTANYCKTCLTKIASDSNKCVCGIDIKKNYDKMKKVNIELQEKIELEKVLAESLKDLNINKNNKKYINIKKSNLKSGGSNNTSNITNWNTYNDNDIIINKRIEYLSDMYNNNIYNIDFKTYINDNSPNKPNFNYEWNYDNKTLTFSPFISVSTQSHQNDDLINIIINYTILDSRFQAELYVWLLNILNTQSTIFKSKWNSLANKINTFKSKNKNEIKKLMTEIIKICEN